MATESTDTAILQKIEISINSLTVTDAKDNITPIPYTEVEKLIWISHGKLWNVAQWAGDKKMPTENQYLLEQEKISIDERRKSVV